LKNDGRVTWSIDGWNQGDGSRKPKQLKSWNASFIVMPWFWWWSSSITLGCIEIWPVRYRKSGKLSKIPF
jgi:hypothetical protein